MRKRILSIIIGMVLCLALSVECFAIGMDSFSKTKSYTGQFTDIQGHWSEPYVADLYEYGLAEGDGAGKMSPDAPVKLSEVIALAARIHAAYYQREIEEADGTWYTRYVNYARKNGLVTEAMTANVTAEATRGETAMIFSKALPVEQFEAVNGEKTYFDVLRLDKWYDAVSLLSKAGVITGFADMSFKPDAGVRRSEALTMADRVVHKEMRIGYLTDNNSVVPGSRDEEVGDYVSFACQGVAIFTMNRRDEGFVLSVSLGTSYATIAGLCELRPGLGLVCPLGERIVQGQGGSGVGSDVISLVFDYDEGLQMTLSGALTSSGELITTLGTPVIGNLCIGTTLTATN